jgi:hypothetical protein
MGREQRAPGAIFTSLGKRLFGPAWDRIAAIDYSRHGPALVRDRFERSRLAVLHGAPDASAAGGPTMPLDEAADVILHLLAREERRWHCAGSLMFAYRGEDPAREQEDREFYPLLRRAHGVSSKQAPPPSPVFQYPRTPRPLFRLPHRHRGDVLVPR